MECAYHLPYLCDCGSTETETNRSTKLVQEEFLEVPEPTPTPTPTGDEELTPQEKKRWGRFLNEFLEEDDATPTPTNQPTPTHSNAPTGNLADEINKALDAREGRQKTDGELGKLRADVDALKPKAKKWHQPWTLFSG